MKEAYCRGKWAVLEGSASAQSGLFRSGTGSSGTSSLVPNCQALPSLQEDPDTCTHVPLAGTSGATSGKDRLVLDHRGQQTKLFQNKLDPIKSRFISVASERKTMKLPGLNQEPFPIINLEV